MVCHSFSLPSLPWWFPFKVLTSQNLWDGLEIFCLIFPRYGTEGNRKESFIMIPYGMYMLCSLRGNSLSNIIQYLIVPLAQLAQRFGLGYQYADDILLYLLMGIWVDSTSDGMTNYVEAVVSVAGPKRFESKVPVPCS